MCFNRTTTNKEIVCCEIFGFISAFCGFNGCEMRLRVTD